MAKILLVDDDLTLVQMVSGVLREDGHEVFPFTNAATAASGLSEHTPEIVITDLYLDKTRTQGLDILAKARMLSPPAVVIVITGFGSIGSAVGAMKCGAFDYLEKPFKLDELKLCVQRAVAYSAAVSETVFLRKHLRKKYEFSQIIGNAPRMQEVFKMIERVADTDSTILVLGESGTGKELVARALHFNSRRQFAPFVPINCSALPENLLESELFGHRQGAFTGAFTDKKGLFHEADGGTIFLDEVGSMSPTLQSRLLRVLQEREVRRVGDNTPVHVDVRVLAATNEPLEKRVKEGTFREDLYYRLNVIAIDLPALRERREDIPMLIANVLNHKVSPRTRRPFQITKAAMALLTAHDWPGNVRELENAIERAMAFCEADTIQPADLPPAVLAAQKVGAGEDESGLATLPTLPNAAVFPLPSDGRAAAPPAPTGPIKPLKNFLREQEAAHVARAMEEAKGDKDQAAILLGVSLATLYRKMAGDE